jgi:hypothetical protein
VTVYLGNAFSLNMLKIRPEGLQIEIVPVAAREVPEEAVSIIGYPETARLVSGLLGRNIRANRASVVLAAGDVLYVAQYHGPRLPEGTTVLPEGASLDFCRVRVIPERSSS